MNVEETGRSRSKDGRFLPEIKDQTIENLQHDHSYVTVAPGQLCNSMEKDDDVDVAYIDEDEDEDDEEEEDCVLDIVMTVNLLKRTQVLQLKVDE